MFKFRSVVEWWLNSDPGHRSCFFPLHASEDPWFLPVGDNFISNHQNEREHGLPKLLDFTFSKVAKLLELGRNLRKLGKNWDRKPS